MHNAHETFSKSPIEEVVFDVQFESSPRPKPALVDEFAKSLSDYFPKTTELAGGVSRVISVTPRIAMPGESRAILLENAAGTEFLRISESSVSFSNVNSYGGWQAFFPMAQLVWKIYTQNTKPGPAVRLGLRYINRFKPPTVKMFGHWFTAYLTLPKIKGGALTRNYYTSVVIPQNDLANTELAIRTVLLDDDTAPTGKAFILDFDIYQVGRWTSSAENSLFGVFSDMHERIYEAFTTTLTDNAREVIK